MLKGNLVEGTPFGRFPSAMDQVIATGLAKQPAERYPTTVEMAAAARSAITGPTGLVLGTRPIAPAPRSTARDASPDPAQTQHWAAVSAAPPPVGAPVSPPPTTAGTARRTGVLIGAVVAIVLLIAGGVFAVRELSRRHDSTASTSAAAPAAAALKAGIYRADFGAATNVDGGPIPGAGRETATWGLRSECNAGRCVATASRVSGGGPPVSSLIFDELDGSWVAVALGSELCDKVPAEVWIVFTLHPDSEGNLSGDYTAVTSGTCSGKGQVTFNRAGDVDVASLPDPASVPPRVSSPAEALRGRYLETTTYANGQPQTEADYAVKTDCLRTGERCMSRFHSPLSGFVPLVFEDGKWTSSLVGNGKCPFGGDLSQVKWTAEYPLPQPPQDPIQSLTGRGHQEQTGSCAVNSDVYIAYKRIGD